MSKRAASQKRSRPSTVNLSGSSFLNGGGGYHGTYYNWNEISTHAGNRQIVLLRDILEPHDEF